MDGDRHIPAGSSGSNSTAAAMTGHELDRDRTQYFSRSCQKRKEGVEEGDGGRARKRGKVSAKGRGRGKRSEQKSEDEEKLGVEEGGRGGGAIGSPGGTLNPILIPSIIYHIGSFLPCQDLKRCRRLNKQWHEECSKLLRLKALVKVTSPHHLLRYITSFQSKPNFCNSFHFEFPQVTCPESLQFFLKFGAFVKSFKLDFSDPSHHLSDRDFYDLIFIKLPNLEELSLVGCISEGAHFLPEEWRVSTHPISNRPVSTHPIPHNPVSTQPISNRPVSTHPISHNPVSTHPIFNNPVSNNSASSQPNSNSSNSAPNNPASTHPSLPLKRLELFLCNASGENVSKPEFLTELLNCVPNLETISVPKVPRMLSFGMPLFHTLITSEQLNLPKLRHLDMDIALYTGSIDILKTKIYPLQYLNAEINSSVTEQSLHIFLETFEKTLTTLQLKFPRSPVASSELPRLEHLRSLKLHGYKGSLDFLQNLRFLQSFELIDNAYTVALHRPNLHRPVGCQFTYKMIWTDWTEENYCFDCNDSSDSQLLRKFSRNFPNLRAVNLPNLNDFDLRVIYASFAHSLQELTMDSPMCTDAGMTGMAKGEVGKEGRERTQLFIGSLKRLRKLEILTPSANLTDASILYGITSCEQLNVLILRNAQITDLGLRTLVDTMHLEHLETTMCANIRAPGVKHALDVITKREMTFIWNTNQSRLTNCCLNKFLNGNEPVTCIVP